MFVDVEGFLQLNFEANGLTDGFELIVEPVIFASGYIAVYGLDKR